MASARGRDEEETKKWHAEALSLASQARKKIEEGDSAAASELWGKAGAKMKLAAWSVMGGVKHPVLDNGSVYLQTADLACKAGDYKDARQWLELAEGYGNYLFATELAEVREAIEVGEWMEAVSAGRGTLCEALRVVVEAGFLVEFRGDESRCGMTLWGRTGKEPLIDSDPNSCYAVGDQENWLRPQYFQSSGEAVERFVTAAEERVGWSLVISVVKRARGRT